MKKFSDYVAESNTKIFDLLIKNNFKGNMIRGEGHFNYRGVKIKFEEGNENLYFSLPELKTKSAPEETIKAIKKFIDEIQNWS